MKEVWKAVVGFEGLYEVSDLGRVRSVPRLDKNKVPRGGHLMQQRINRGYWYVFLRKNGGKKTGFRTHRLVLTAFRGPCPKGQEGCHGKEGRLLNNLVNLRWDTKVSNTRDRDADGTTARGMKNGGGGKLSDDDVREIRARILTGEETYDQIGATYGVSKGLIGHIKAGRAWSHVR